MEKLVNPLNRYIESPKHGHTYSCLVKGEFMELYYYKGFFYDKLGWPKFPETIFTRRYF